MKQYFEHRSPYTELFGCLGLRASEMGFAVLGQLAYKYEALTFHY